MHRLKNQQELDRLCQNALWHDAFVREVSIVSPSYIDREKGGTVSADALPCNRLLVSSWVEEEDIYGIELIFAETEQFSISFLYDLDPCARMQSNKIEWFFHGEDGDPTISHELYFRFLPKKTLGKILHYASDDPFDEYRQLSLRQ